MNPDEEAELQRRYKEQLNRPPQRISATGHLTEGERTLKFLEGVDPLRYDKDGNLVEGTAPGELIEKYWSILSHSVALANLDENRMRIVSLMIRKIKLLNMVTIPKRSYSVFKYFDHAQLDLTGFTQATKAYSATGDRDRKLLISTLSMSEHKGSFTESLPVKKGMIGRLGEKLRGV